jgi:hypothetical protein
MKGRGRRRQAGQAIVETVMILPVVLLFVLGAYDGSIFASNQVQAVTAVRNGARTGALLGGKGNSGDQVGCKGAIPSGFSGSDTDIPADGDGDQDSIDSTIVQAVLRGTVNMSYIRIQEIDIYQPRDPGGKYTVGDLIDHYDATGNELKTGGPPATDTQTFDIKTHRCQGIAPGSQAELGVQMIWTYQPANAILGQKTAPCSAGHPCIPNLTDWAVEKLAFCDAACHE